MSGSLTDAQRQRIEENKRRALAKRAEKLQNSPQKSVPVLTKPNTCNNTSIVKPTASTMGSNELKLVQRNTVGSSSLGAKPDIWNDNKPLKAGSDGSNVITRPKIKVGIAPSDSSNVINRPKIKVGIAPMPCHSSIDTKAAEKNKLSVQERIEENRRKALEKLAVKKNLSPSKPTSSSDKASSSDCFQGANHGSKTELARVDNTNFDKSSSNPHVTDVNTTSSGFPSISGTSSLSRVPEPWNSKQPTTNKPTNQQSAFLSHDKSAATAGSNMFQTLGMKPVKGSSVLISRDRFEVKVGFSPPLVEFFKNMETKLYDAVTKKWSFKLSEYHRFMTALKGFGPGINIEPLPKAILQAFSAQVRGDNPSREVPMADLSQMEPGLVNALMSFQREGVNYGIWKNGRVLIADDMGLGKTIQAICLACFYRKEWPLLIVVPSSVRFDWAQQFQRWVPSLDPQQINVAVTGKDSCSSGLINILSYELMSRKADMLRQIHFQVIIMDECHLLKNYRTARCKAAMPLLQNSRRVILLSGTPALSRPSELYTQICAVCPFMFKFNDFGVRYCDGKQQPWGWDFSGSSNMAELQLLLEEKVMIRRLKKDVLSELPDKVRQMVLLDPRSIKVDKDLKNASKIIGSAKLKGMEQRGALLEFFHQSGKAKMAAVKTYVQDLLEGDRKFIIFAHHQEVLDGVETVVKDKIGSRYIRIDGRTSSEQRNVFCKKFQLNDTITVAILSITAANAGLNLSAATLVVFAELFWNPGILVQAEDRAHRIGQQDSVSIHYLVATGTSDDHIWPMIQKKLDVLGKAGLTKDDFSSADTTRVKDPRQEEITKFLEESFSEDMVSTESTSCDVDDIKFSEEVEDRRKPKTKKQLSIDKFCSPLKHETHTSNPVPSTPPKPKGLFKYFSPEKKPAEIESGLDNISDERTKLGECDKDFETKLGECDNDFETKLGACDNDFETFLKDEDDIFYCDTEPGWNASDKRSKYDARKNNDCETKSRLSDGDDKRSKFEAISDCDIFNDDDDLFDEIKEPQYKKQRR